jgi:Arf-GAP/coiled-coil/ANK repeat/PH domain-containing protein
VLNVNIANVLCDVTKQVLTYAQQSRERANYEQAALADQMQEYRQQMEQENQRSFSDVDSLATGHGIQVVDRSSHKLIEAVIQKESRGSLEIAASTTSISGSCCAETDVRTRGPE